MDFTTDPCLLAQDLADAKLKDLEFVKKIKAALCPGLFERAGETASRRIMIDCLKRCGGDKDMLAMVLQSKFIADHSPFYWTLAGSQSVSSYSSLPPLLSKFLEICGTLSPDIQDEILDALYRLDNDTFYQQLRPHLPTVGVPPSVQPSFEYWPPSVAGSTVYGHAEIKFSIPQLFDRLLIDQEVTLPSCLANDSIWILKASLVTNPPCALEWQLEITETHRRHKRKRISQPCSRRYQNAKEATVSIEKVVGKGGLSMSGRCVGEKQSECKTMQVRVTDVDLSSFHGNDYLAKGRSLSGTATVKEGTADRPSALLGELGPGFYPN